MKWQSLNLKFSRDSRDSVGLCDVVFTQFWWLYLCFHINIDGNVFYQKMLVTIESMKQLIYNYSIFLKIYTYNNIGFNTQPTN